MNEEMYEEEDDDFQSQMRRLRLITHNHGGPFNGRMTAHMAVQAQTRIALMQQLQQNSAYRQRTHQQHFNPSMAMPQMHNQYRQAPYSMPGDQGFRPNHQRSASVATPGAVQGYQQHFDSQTPYESPDQRRMSLPAEPAPATPHGQAGQQTHQAASDMPSYQYNFSPNMMQLGFASHPHSMSSPLSAPLPTSTYPPSTPQSSTVSPLTTSMSYSDQQLAAAFTPDGGFSPYMFDPSNMPQPPMYSYNPNPKAGFDGKTMSPLDMTTTGDSGISFTSPSSGVGDGNSMPFQQSFGGMNFGGTNYKTELSGTNSRPGSGAVTPSFDMENFEPYLDASAWETSPTGSQS